MYQGRRRLVRRSVGRQPFDQTFHRRNAPCDIYIGEVQFRPSCDLSSDIAFGLAIVGEADAVDVDEMQVGQGLDHRTEERSALVGVEFGQGWIPEDPAFQTIHHVESGADNGVVVAQEPRPGTGEAYRMERVHHTMFALDGVRRRHQRSGRFTAQHEGLGNAADLRIEPIGGVRLPARELRDMVQHVEPGDRGPQVPLERSDIEPQSGAEVVRLAHGSRVNRGQVCACLRARPPDARGAPSSPTSTAGTST